MEIQSENGFSFEKQQSCEMTTQSVQKSAVKVKKESLRTQIKKKNSVHHEVK